MLTNEVLYRGEVDALGKIKDLNVWDSQNFIRQGLNYATPPLPPVSSFVAVEAYFGESGIEILQSHQ